MIAVLVEPPARFVTEPATEGLVFYQQGGDPTRLAAAWNVGTSIVMDPAYVHITRGSVAEHARCKRILNAHGVYPIGRYGGWTYCSIEDNILEARALVADFEA